MNRRHLLHKIPLALKWDLGTPSTPQACYA